MWRSPVAHHVRDVGVAGSNPVIPTKETKAVSNGCLFCLLLKNGFKNTQNLGYIQV